MSCIYKYKGKDYTKKEFYSLVSSSNFIQQEQVKKFAELQERLNNKEFLEGAKFAFESSEELQELGTQEQYNDYIARVSLGIIKNPTSDEYNYESKVRDILYHGTTSKNKFDKFDSELNNFGGYYFTLNQSVASDYGSAGVIMAIINSTNPLNVVDTSPDMPNHPKVTYEPFKDNNYDYVSYRTDFEKDRTYHESVVRNAEQIHILGSKQDIQGFKEFVETSTLSIDDENPQVITDEYGNTRNEVDLSGRAGETIFLQKESQSSQKPDENIDAKIQRFLEKIGVSVHAVRNIRDKDGNIVPAVAVADMLNKIIQVIEDRADLSTLPEEAATFFINMLGDHHPLLKRMMDNITKYKIYSETVQQYKSRPEYRNQDGTVNFTKMRKEAVTKLIAYHIIKNEKGAETDTNLTAAMRWWHKLWDWIKSVFSKTDENPFEEAAESILEGDISELTDLNSEEVFYQLDGSLKDLEEDQKKIKLDDSVDDRTGQKRHIYYYDGVPAKGSVTTVYVDRWLKQRFKNRPDSRNEAQKQLDLLKAEFGDGIHAEFQNVAKSWTNPDGTKKDTQSAIAPVTNSSVYNKINQYMQELMAQYEEGSIFKTEVKIFDKKTQVAGSIDLLVIRPDGTVNIYDWKSQEIGPKQTDIKLYKEPMYRIQLENYRKILKEQYGFNKFGLIRAIPIRTMLEKTGSQTKLKDIEIGSLDASQIPDEKSYLLPVNLQSESTGDEQLDALLKKLYGIYKKIEIRRAKGEEYEKQKEELSRLRLAIRDLHTRGRVERLIDVGVIEYKKYSKMLQDGTLYGKSIDDAIRILSVFSDSAIYLDELLKEAESAAKNHSEQAYEYYKRLNDRFSGMTRETQILMEKIENYRKEQAAALSEKNGIMNFLDPETKIGTLKGMFSALSNIQQKSFRLFSKLLRRAQNIRNDKTTKMLDELVELKKDFSEWCSKKGISEREGLNMMLNLEEGKNPGFLNKYTKEFREQVDRAYKEGDLKWLVENLEFDDKKYKEKEKRQIEFYNSIPYSSDESENKKIIQDKIATWKLYNQVVKENGEVNQTALLNQSILYDLMVPDEKWQSDQWKELHKKENEPLLKVYEYFQMLLRISEKLGMLDKYSPHFIPSMSKTGIDGLLFGTNMRDIFNRGFFESLRVEHQRNRAPETDPTDGSIINKIPVFFTEDIGIEKNGIRDYSNKSLDLFKVFAVWGAHMYNYEAMQSIEDDALMILQTEKKHREILKTDRFGNVVEEHGKIQTIPGDSTNNRNAKLLEDFVNYYLYNRLGNEDKDFKLKLPFSKKEYSGVQVIRAMSKFFTLKTLALNPVSGTANFVGGYGNTLFTAQKGIMFTKTDWARAMKLIASDKKTRAALNMIDGHVESRFSNRINKLSLSASNRILNEDNAYVIQRMGDSAVQEPVTAAVLLNHTIVDGEIVHIETHVKSKYDYNNTFYSLSKEERKKLRDKIDKEVGELKKNKSLISLGTLDENGKFSLPVDKEQIYKLQDRIKAINKKIIGNASFDDINQIRTNMLGMALMQFRSWMPEMIEERFGGLQYNEAGGYYTYGKINLFLSEVFSKKFPTLLKSLIIGFGDDGIRAAKDRYEEEKRKAFEKGQEFTITEGEFIDMYIATLRSEMLELIVIISFVGLVLAFNASMDDDDEDIKGYKRYLARMLGKYEQEFLFHYDLTEFTSLVKSPIPLIGLAEDMIRFSKAIVAEMYGQVFDKEIAEKAKPMKYFFRMVPVAKEAMLWMAAADDDFRKDWDIRIK